MWGGIAQLLSGPEDLAVEIWTPLPGASLPTPQAEQLQWLQLLLETSVSKLVEAPGSSEGGHRGPSITVCPSLPPGGNS